MTRLPRSAFSVALCGLALLWGAGVAEAQTTVDRLAELIRTSGQSPNPTMAFLRGIGDLGDFDLNQSQIRQALAQANVAPTGVVAQILDPCTRLRKRGNKVNIDRNRDTTLAMGQGAVKIGREVEFRLQFEGSDARIDKVEGIQVGETADSLYDLWRIVFTRENNKNVAKVTAGTFIFSKTITIDLTPPPPPPAPPTSSAPAVEETDGLIGSLPGG